MSDPDDPADDCDRGLGRALVGVACVYVFVQHTGTWFTWLGAMPLPGVAGRTRWADWIDLLTPYGLVGAVAWTLHVGRSGQRAWVFYVLGVTSYCVGHGVHLAANSVGNDTPGDVAHLWDELVGHVVTQTGVVLLVVALGPALMARAWPTGTMVPVALTVGLTHATNALEGGTAWFGLAAAALFTAWGWRGRAVGGTALLWAYVPALALILAYGLWRGGFPQPSSLDVAVLF